jgi:hypothetical protein
MEDCLLKICPSCGQEICIKHEKSIAITWIVPTRNREPFFFCSVNCVIYALTHDLVTKNPILFETNKEI